VKREDTTAAGCFLTFLLLSKASSSDVGHPLASAHTLLARGPICRSGSIDFNFMLCWLGVSCLVSCFAESKAAIWALKFGLCNLGFVIVKRWWWRKILINSCRSAVFMVLGARTVEEKDTSTANSG